jgi:hypothetical protein
MVDQLVKKKLSQWKYPSILLDEMVIPYGKRLMMNEKRITRMKN